MSSLVTLLVEVNLLFDPFVESQLARWAGIFHLAFMPFAFHYLYLRVSSMQTVHSLLLGFHDPQPRHLTIVTGPPALPLAAACLL